IAGLLCGVARKTTIETRDPVMAARCAIFVAAQAAITFNGALFPTCYGIQFAEQPRNRNIIYSRPIRFDMICEANGIEHHLTKPNHPWTNGQIERMNRTIKDATVKRFHYDDHDQLRTHLTDFMAAYNFARRLKTLGGLTPYEYICKTWTSEPDRFILNPIHQMPGLNT
ncbi:integrase core domain-containing protein, partial [Roseovarius indicus]|uniref:integrase core domain-containing protein n=1 Tax=Roseovarius indicus TaxID=540747 RepID=UPI0040585541